VNCQPDCGIRVRPNYAPNLIVLVAGLVLVFDLIVNFEDEDELENDEERASCVFGHWLPLEVGSLFTLR